MEFPFDIGSYLGAPETQDGPFIAVIDENSFRGRQGDRAGGNLCIILEALGKSSAVAQGLKKPVTFGSPHLIDQRIYLMVDGNVAFGFLKVGAKRLFVEPPPANGKEGRVGVQEAFKEINPLCALDFYVHESCQRHGYGRMIFDEMLVREGVQPHQLAYDRPSPKLMGFLRKHFTLTRYRPQNNNFVVFDDYFEALRHGSRAKAALATSAAASGMPPGTVSSRSNAASGCGVGVGGGGATNAAREHFQFHDSRPPPLPQTNTTLADSTGGGLGFVPPRGASLGAFPQQGMTRQGYSSMPFTPASGSAVSNGIGGNLPTPWGTDMDNMQRGRIGVGSEHRRGQLGHIGGGTVGSVGVHSAVQEPLPSPAGMPSRGDGNRGQNRAASVPTGRSDSRGSLGSRGAAGLASGGASNRYESPLSHAGQRMVHR